MQVCKTSTIIVCSRPFPHNFIPEIILPEHLIHQYLDIMSDMPIQVHVDAGRVAHHGLDGHQVFVHPVEVALLVPDVAIHLFLKSLQFFYVQFVFCLAYRLRHPRISPQVHLLGIVRAAGKGRVDVHQVHGDAAVLEVGAGGEALAADDEVVRRVGGVAHVFAQFGFVVGHAAGDALHHAVVIPVAENAAGADEVVQQGLSFQRVGEVG